MLGKGHILYSENSGNDVLLIMSHPAGFKPLKCLY